MSTKLNHVRKHTLFPLIKKTFKFPLLSEFFRKNISNLIDLIPPGRFNKGTYALEINLRYLIFFLMLINLKFYYEILEV